MTLTALLVAVTATMSVARYWLCLRSVERYAARVGDHDKVIEYALVVLPWRRPP